MKHLNFVLGWQNVKYVLIYVDIVLVTCDLLLKKPERTAPPGPNLRRPSFKFLHAQVFSE